MKRERDSHPFESDTVCDDTSKIYSIHVWPKEAHCYSSFSIILVLALLPISPIVLYVSAMIVVCAREERWGGYNIQGVMTLTCAERGLMQEGTTTYCNLRYGTRRT